MSVRQQFQEFTREVNKKNRSTCRKHIKKIIGIPIVIGLSLGLFMPSVVPVPEEFNPIGVFFINWYFIAVGFMNFLLVLTILYSTGYVAKHNLQTTFEDHRAFFNFIANYPNKDKIIRLLHLLSDILEKNAIEGYLSIAQTFDNLYKRIGRVEKRMDESDKIQQDQFRRNNIDKFNTSWNMRKLEREVSELKEQVRILNESKKQDDQIRNKKLGIQNNEDIKSDKLKDVDDAE